MDASEVVICLLIGKIHEVMCETTILPREALHQLSKSIEVLKEVLYDTSSSQVVDASSDRRQQQDENVTILARQAEDIADAFLVGTSIPPRSRKDRLVHLVEDLMIGSRAAHAKAWSLVEKLEELSWHFSKMGGRFPHIQRDPPKVLVELTGSNSGNRSEQADELAIIGREGDSEWLVERLKNSDKFQVISVTGEEGIGKTALVRSVYNLPEIEHHFPCRAWISGSNNPSLERVFVDIIKQCPAKELKDLDRMEFNELVMLLCRLLAESRYLIVIDDWNDIPGLENMLVHFPNSGAGDRLIMMFRNVKFTPSFRSWGSSRRFEPLTEETSRELLLRGALIEDKVIEMILSKCKGSPMKLLLCKGVVLATDAGSSSPSLSSSSVLKWFDELGEDPPLQAVMHLSYRKLPHWLKPCLLYLCLFPRGSEISTRRVFQLWYAEGLACRDGPNTAKACLQELLNRNIVQLLTRRKANGSPKTCCLQGHCHDYLSGLAKRFGFFHIDVEDKDSSGRQPSPTAASPMLARYWGDNTSHLTQETKTASHIRCYVSFNTQKSGKQSREVKLLLKQLEGMPNCTFLRVLDLEGVYKPILPEQFGDLLPNLRYLGLRWTILDQLPESVVNLSRLETLDLKHTNVTKLPGSILRSKYLRRLYLNKVSFDNSCIPSENCLRTMETLWGLLVREGSKMLGALGKFYGLKKLGLMCHSVVVKKAIENISALTELESLQLRSRDLFGQPAKIELSDSMEGLQSLSKLYLLGSLEEQGANLDRLPKNLRIVTLSMSKLNDDPMKFLGQLQHLVILRLLAKSYVGETITCPGDSFPSLRELRLWKLEKLTTINMEAGSMQSLEELEIRCCLRVDFHGLNHALKLKLIKLTTVSGGEDFTAELKSACSNEATIIISRGLPGFMDDHEDDEDRQA